jgi:hypothetical protein
VYALKVASAGHRRRLFVFLDEVLHLFPRSGVFKVHISLFYIKEKNEFLIAAVI